MPKVQASILINAPVETVYDYVLHAADNGPIWIPSVMEHRNVSSREPQVGQSWEWTFNMLGVLLQGRSELTALEHNRRGEMKTSGSADSNWVFTYATEGSGTRVTAEIDYQIPSTVLGKVANRVMIERVNQKQAEEGLANLKIVLES